MGKEGLRIVLHAFNEEGVKKEMHNKRQNSTTSNTNRFIYQNHNDDSDKAQIYIHLIPLTRENLIHCVPRDDDNTKEKTTESI
jgi:hypothetical protein